jgi:hypothetical protein
MSPRAASLLGPALVLALAACATSSGRTGFDDSVTDSEANEPAPAPSGDFGKEPAPEAPPVEIAEVYGHSARTLYRLDPTTKEVVTVGTFQGCQDVIDIAIDEESNIIGTGFFELYAIDKGNAACTLIARGQYPNSLSYVPKGTVDPDVEALVGYNDGTYVRIDPTTGALTSIGSLGGNLHSSGDIVSVKGGKTYLTVKDAGFGGGSCSQSDCLVEVDPKTGALIKNWGSVGYKDVFGLAFWGGNVYGFDDSGNLFEVTFDNGQLKTGAIPIPQRPANLAFWGAGSTTSAPLVSTQQ